VVDQGVPFQTQCPHHQFLQKEAIGSGFTLNVSEVFESQCSHISKETASELRQPIVIDPLVLMC
ncbi:MAG TPA: hypothetical protein VIK81_02865, partial [Patescibacteria group bacterium]